VAIITLSTAEDPRIAEYASVADPELARAGGFFIAEGRLVLRRLIEDGRYCVRSVLLSEAAQQQLDGALARLDPGVPVYVCPVRAFRDVTGFNMHRGCVALVERPAPRGVREVLDGARLVVLLESIANPDNVGGIFRNAAAFGADGVLLDVATCDPLYRKAIRTSMGAVLRVPFARVAWADALPIVRSTGFTVVALTPDPAAEPIDRFAENRRGGHLALLLGNEGSGLSEAAAASADSRVRIPTTSVVDSLNVAVAAGIALSRLSRLTRFAEVG
jgi:tRNA G18 (ribose-2'-O)-methylase SpoU